MCECLSIECMETAESLGVSEGRDESTPVDFDALARRRACRSYVVHVKTPPSFERHHERTHLAFLLRFVVTPPPYSSHQQHCNDSRNDSAHNRSYRYALCGGIRLSCGGLIGERGDSDDFRSAEYTMAAVKERRCCRRR